MSLDIPLRTVAGRSVGQVSLDEAVFGIQPNLAVLHQVVTAQLAAARAGTQSTRTRAEVSGGGKKPYKQKGTGRARQGSIRAPQWVGGGVALGPKPRSYRQKTPKKMVQLALRSALSDRAAADRIAVVDDWPWEEPRTAEARRSLSALGLSGRVLVVLDADLDDDAYRSFRNLPEAQTLSAGELNAYDILCNDWILFSRRTLPGSGNEVVEPVGSEDEHEAGVASADAAEEAEEAEEADEVAAVIVDGMDAGGEAAVSDAAGEPVTEATMSEAPAPDAGVEQGSQGAAPVEEDQ